MDFWLTSNLIPTPSEGCTISVVSPKTMFSVGTTIIFVFCLFLGFLHLTWVWCQYARMFWLFGRITPVRRLCWPDVPQQGSFHTLYLETSFEPKEISTDVPWAILNIGPTGSNVFFACYVFFACCGDQISRSLGSTLAPAAPGTYMAGGYDAPQLRGLAWPWRFWQGIF